MLTVLLYKPLPDFQSKVFNQKKVGWLLVPLLRRMPGYVLFPSPAMSLILEYCDQRSSAMKIQAVWRHYWLSTSLHRCVECRALVCNIDERLCHDCFHAECVEETGEECWCADRSEHEREYLDMYIKSCWADGTFNNPKAHWRLIN